MTPFPYTEDETTRFLRREVPALLAGLASAQVPTWGQLTPQHMVEHLAGAMRLSMGRYNLPAPPASPALDLMQTRLQANAPFPPGVRNPRMAATPGPLRHASLTAATTELLLTIDEFFDHYARQPAATAVHPMFGPLDFGQWRVFHFKHFSHHFFQFGLLPTNLLPRPAG
ncbi:DUF1569 domain-containing protein [Hymenobacter lapidiphilus]|uniref:DUF1569 domain-containing protein n=1 Tax=Hymenobacter lapidiphilus TaxID=2608003 RepID=A0A7Y7PQ85_9BACT|nr:DUF1569 domain-containing protein [Hymenobacter lapidiphilus]NVO31837.1 DUF1569 domain-containing protein [Hymenobacter lapidiphilus]